MHTTQRPSCQYLTHKHATFFGCTLAETGWLIGILAAIQLPLITGLAFPLGHYLGGFWGAFLIEFLIAVLLTRFVLLTQIAKRIGERRQGKPAGYLRWRFRWWCYQHLGVPLPLVIRQGVWSTRRHHDV